MIETFDPVWKKHEKDINSNNAEISKKASEAFEQERELELRTSKKAREWEKSRKERIAKDKPQWVKERIKEENKDLTEFKSNLKAWKGFESNLKPCPNYLIVDVKENEESKSGLIIVGQDFLRNDGTCIDIGGDFICQTNANVIKPPCKAGDHILFKKGAGIDIEINKKNYKFMMYQDVLAIFQDA